MSENRNLKADGMLDRHMGVGYSLFFYFACTLNLPLIKQTVNQEQAPYGKDKAPQASRAHTAPEARCPISLSYGKD